MSQQVVTLDYKPRKAFLPFHQRTHRWACVVAHRRAGKTVAAINDLIRAAITCNAPNALFGFIAPYRSQSKSVAWGYLKQFAAPITANTNEQELTVTLVNGAAIRLFGADNADAIRGLGFNGVVCDEYGDWRPSVFPLVVRPALSDRQGWCVMMGTPKGRNSFYDVYARAQKSTEWFCMSLPADRSGLLPPTELDAARAQMTDDQFAQEYLCSFTAAIVGAIYGVEMRQAEDHGRIVQVPYDPSVPCHTAWDLGWRDDTAIWFYQVIRGEIHVIDFHAVSGATIKELAATVLGKPYKYGKHHLPHDARAKTLASGGKSIIEQMAEFLGLANLTIVPDLGLQDGIQAVRRMLPRCWFDAERTQDGLEALRQYQREYDEDKKTFRVQPRHDWCFVGETEILTRYGTQQIMNLPYTGEVLTSCGWKRYINPRITRKNASLVEVQFANGYSVKCTPDHLFKTVNGWISAESLTKGMQIQSALTRSPNILMAVFTAFGLAKNTIRAAAKNCIEMFGAWRLVPFQTAATSITKMETPPTMSFQILNACPQKFIYPKLGTNIQEKDSIKLRDKKPQIGTSLKRDVYGIKDTLNDKKAGLNGNASRALAFIVQTPLMLWLGRTIRRSIAEILVKLQHIGSAVMTKRQQLVIERVLKLNQVDDVWCLTVPDAEEFALANGAIVHNCSHPADAFRMLAVAWQAEPPRPEIIKPKTLIVGPENEVTLNDMWAAHERQQPRRARI